jgi:hypothetical protein
MPSNPAVEIGQTVASFLEGVEESLGGWLSARSPSGFRDTEMEVAAACRALADDISTVILLHILGDPAFQARASVAARSGAGRKLRNGGRRHQTIKLLGGGSVRVAELEYLKPDRRGRRPGRRRKTGRRGKGGAGVFPALAALGIWWGVSPALAEEVCRQVADSDSVRAARQALARRDIDPGHKQTLKLFNKFSGRAVEQRNRWLEEALEKASATKGVLGGKRVVVATDGGRLRERVSAPAGRRRANGHRGYKAPWREPKLLVIYVIGDDGKVEGEFRPIYDGTMKDADAIFEMIAGYLKALGVEHARQLIFVADGAKWIWNRTEELARQMGLAPDKVEEVVDWFHAVEVLWEIAKMPAKWSHAQRDTWVRKAKKLLHGGEIERLVALMRTLVKGRRAKKVSKHLDYFIRNAHRMQYAGFVSRNVPIGSGAIESAVRRIVNMRMKSNGTFWLEVNAEGMLLIRSYLKARRFEEMVHSSLSQAAPWWPPSLPDNSYATFIPEAA